VTKLGLSSLKSLGTKEKILIILLVTVSLWAVYYRAIHRPNLYRIKELQSQIREIQDKIFKTEDLIPASYLNLERKLKDLKEDHATIKQEIDSFYSEMASKSQISELLKYLMAKSSNSDNFEFIFVKAQSLEETKFYQRLPLKISLTGDYNQIIGYLRRLEYLSRPMKVTNLQLQADPEILPALNVYISLVVLLQNHSEEKSSTFEQKLSKVNLKNFQKTKWTDPFTAYKPAYLMTGKDKLPEVEDLTLSGIIWSSKTPSAVINGSTVRVGDDIEGLEVVEILKDGVILNRRNERVKLKLK